MISIFTVAFVLSAGVTLWVYLTKQDKTATSATKIPEATVTAEHDVTSRKLEELEKKYAGVNERMEENKKTAQKVSEKVIQLDKESKHNSMVYTTVCWRRVGDVCLLAFWYFLPSLQKYFFPDL